MKYPTRLWGCYDCIEHTDSFVLVFGLVKSWIVKRSLARYSIVAYWQSHMSVARLISYSLLNMKSTAFIKFIATKFSCFVSITVALYEGTKNTSIPIWAIFATEANAAKGFTKKQSNISKSYAPCWPSTLRQTTLLYRYSDLWLVFIRRGHQRLGNKPSKWSVRFHLQTTSAYVKPCLIGRQTRKGKFFSTISD